MTNFASAVGKWGKRLTFGLLGAGLAVCLSGSPSQAQSKMQVMGGYSFGSESSNFFCGQGCAVGLHGYAASFAYNFTPHVGMEATFTGHNGTSVLDSDQFSNQTGEDVAGKNNYYVYTFGPRLTLPTGNFSLFTHFLVGATHESLNLSETCLQPTQSETECFSPGAFKYTGTGFAFKTGGGVDWNHRAWGIRILEVDYVRGQIPATITGTEPDEETTINEHFASSSSSFELVTGVTFNLGGSAK